MTADFVLVGPATTDPRFIWRIARTEPEVQAIMQAYGCPPWRHQPPPMAERTDDRAVWPGAGVAGISVRRAMDGPTPYDTDAVRVWHNHVRYVHIWYPDGRVVAPRGCWCGQAGAGAPAPY